MKAKSLIGLIICIAIIAGLIFTAFFGFTLTNPFTGTEYKFPKVFDEEDGIKRGLDLVGGSIISFEASVENPSAEDLDAAEQVLRNRLDSQGYFDAIITRQAEKFIRVEIPDIDNPEDAVQLLKADAVLKFTDAAGEVIMEGGTGVEKAQAAYGPLNDQGEQGHYVQLTLTSEGQKKFAEATAAAATKPQGENVVRIMLDDTEISAPQVSEKIDSKTCIITGNFTEQTAKILADQIQSGQLPFSLKESELRAVGPTLGSKALETSLFAALIGIVIVLLFMLVIYRLPGLIADIALLCYIALVALIMAGYFMPGDFTATLTLPGIAGIILSIGMAVDANVIASERIREEFRKGKTIDGAISAGFDNSFNAVLDGNVTVFIVSAVMMGAFGTTDTFMGKIFSPVMQFFGSSVTGSIYSFGYTLLIGVIFNMLMGVYFSRAMLKSISRFKFLRKPWLYGGAKNAK